MFLVDDGSFAPLFDINHATNAPISSPRHFYKSSLHMALLYNITREGLIQFLIVYKHY